MSASNTTVDGLVFQAEKKLKEWSLFNSDKYQEAIALFDKAAATAKIEKDWTRAGDLYVQIATIHQKYIKDDSDYVNYYINAAKAYKNCLPEKSKYYFEIVIKLLVDANRISAAAKFYKELGELHEKSLDYEKACLAYTNAINYFDSEDNITQSNSCNVKLAQIFVCQKHYEKACLIFVHLSNRIYMSRPSTTAISGYLLQALLCQFLLGSDSDSIQERVCHYDKLYPGFAETREAGLIIDFCQDFLDQDYDSFLNHRLLYETITKLDNCTINLLEEINKNITGKSDNFTGAAQNSVDFTGAKSESDDYT
jgi:alpha-soluble NSF attachment protein